MGWHLLKNYIKENAIAISLTLIAMLLVDFLVQDKLMVYFGVIYILISNISGYYKYKKHQVLICQLKEKGITEEEVDDSSFIEKWNTTRQKGIYRYCLIEGIVSWGTILAGIFLLIGCWLSIWPTPFQITQIIWSCCPLAGIIGLFIGLFLWAANEKKFIRLTSQTIE